MRIFIDTSAFYALLDKDDSNHSKARKAWPALLKADNILVTTNYVLIESFALLQRRLGLDAIRGFQEDLLPLVNIEYVDAETHGRAISVMLTASRRDLSLVDCASFEIMRSLGIKAAFAFDPHFREQGFTVVPPL
jgi:predicted nucleic acid-binding protein